MWSYWSHYTSMAWTPDPETINFKTSQTASCTVHHKHAFSSSQKYKGVEGESFQRFDIFLLYGHIGPALGLEHVPGIINFTTQVEDIMDIKIMNLGFSRIRMGVNKVFKDIIHAYITYGHIGTPGTKRPLISQFRYRPRGHLNHVQCIQLFPHMYGYGLKFRIHSVHICSYLWCSIEVSVGGS